ncbi:MAG TPA: ATP-binding protein, partial [Bacteroidales bacterium]|nr:ATP-binding protein [Bacteroidales bacterium]
KLHVAEKNGTLDLTIGNNNDIIVLIDETHFCNLISNLLDNAIKYSQGPPEISVKVEIKKNEVLISVADKGIGISKDAQKYIFEKFFREHTGYVHNVKGFGLGLAYARTVTEAFKGKIDVKSKSGMGSIFTVRLPLYN